MPQARDDAGNLWETDAQGNAVRLISAQQAPAQNYIPPNAAKVAQQGRENARADASAGREQVRTDIAVSGEGRADRKEGFDFSRNLRNDFDAAAPVKAYQTIIRQYGNGISAAPSAAGDQALINSYSQMLNPTSTVMLGEYQAAEQNDTVLNKVRERLKREFGWDGAGRISDIARAQLLDEMQGITVNANRSYNQERDRYRAIAARNGVPAEDVIGPHIGEPFFDSIEQARLGLRKAKTQTGDPEFEREDSPGVVGGVTDTSPARPPMPPSGDYRSSYMGQGMSGFNEGLASTLGAPIDLATMGLNLIPQGINAATNSQLPTIENPTLGSEWIKDRMGGWGVYAPTKDGGKQFVRRASQSVGSAAVPVAGAPGALARARQALAMSAGGGVGAATAQQFFPNNPVAEFTGEVLGSGMTAGGLLGSSRRAAVKKAMQEVPTRENLRDQATNLYNTAESRGIVAGPNVTTNLAGRIGDIADQEKMRWPNGKVDPNYTKAGAALDMMSAHSGQSIDPKQIQMMRENLMDAVRATQGKEKRIAGKMLDAFDAETIPLAPELADARRVASRYLQADQVGDMIDLARKNSSTFSGSGYENALRTQFRSADKAITSGRKQFAPAVEDAIAKVNNGTRLSNALRTVGKAAPTGIVSGGLGAGVPYYIGSSMGGPVAGGLASLGTMGIGALARKAATDSTSRYAQIAEVLARNGGPLKLPPLVDDETQKAIKAALAGLGSQYIPR